MKDTPRTMSYWVEMSDPLYQPDPRLLAEIERLRELEWRDGNAYAKARTG
jgi:hypothetical protein